MYNPIPNGIVGGTCACECVYERNDESELAEYLCVGCVMNFPNRRALNILIALLVDVAVSLDSFSKSENGNIYPY